MSRRTSGLSALCLLAILVAGSVGQPATRLPRYASCTSCSQDRPGALSSPWYGEPEDDSRREYRGIGREPSPFRIRPDFRGPVFPSPYQHLHHHESEPSDHETYGIRKPDYYRHSHPHPVTPAAPPAPRPGLPVSPNLSRGPIQFPFTPSAEYRTRDFTRRTQNNPERNQPGPVGPKRERGQPTGSYASLKERYQLEGNVRNLIRSEDQEDQTSREVGRVRTERNRERESDGPRRFRNERNQEESDGPRRFRNERNQEESVGPRRFRNERNEEEESDGPRRFRNERQEPEADIPRRVRPERQQSQVFRDQSNQETRGEVQFRPEPEDSDEENPEAPEATSPLDNLGFRIATVDRPRPVQSRQVQSEDEPTNQPRKDRSREAEILRVTQITIDPEAAYSEDAQPDMSVLRFTPENARGARPFGGFGGGWEEEEYVDIRKETPFGTSEMVSVDKESFGPGGFQEERFTEEFDSFGWRRQAEGEESPVVVIQSREAPKDQPDLSVEASADEPVQAEDAVMKIAPRQAKDKNLAQKDSSQNSNPDFYGDIVYPPTNQSQVVQVPAENTTVLPRKVE